MEYAVLMSGLMLAVLLASAQAKDVDPAQHTLAQRARLRKPAPGKRMAIDPAARQLVQLARRDLAARLEIEDDSRIETLRAQSKTWPDSSLGCPKPGLSYAQVMTPGYLIELRAAGRTWSYHSDLRQVIHCEAAGPGGRLGRSAGVPPPAPGPVEK